MGTVSTSYLSKTLQASNRKTWTFSTWLKIPSYINSDQTIWANSYSANSSYYTFVTVNANFQVQVQGVFPETGGLDITTNRKLLDASSWYHIVVRFDTTQSTASDRVRIYINGVQETSFATNTIPPQNQNLGINMNVDHRIGNFAGLNRNFYGLLAHTHFADGQSYASSTFGETDSTTNEWKPKLSPSVTYGTNGFFLKYENAGNFGLDSSGQSNNMATSGTFTQDTDTPSNNFMTLDKHQAYEATVNGSGEVDHSGTAMLGTSGNARGANGTMMMSDGKWYAEFKLGSNRDNANGNTISIYKNGTHASRRWRNQGANAIVGKETGSNGCEGITYQPYNEGTPNLIDDGGGGTVNYGVEASVNDIIMLAVDLTSATSKIWFGKNGTWFNAPSTSSAGNPATGAYPGLSFAKGDEFWGINVTAIYNASNQNKYMYCNFGRGCFGTTAVSSGNADSAGKGTFEYAPPSSYLSICTSNIKNTG